MRHELVYNLIYALAAQGERERRLFGTCHALSCIAFQRSDASDAFPELWFEIPLAGDPWFDLHVLTARSGIQASHTFASEGTGGRPATFEWFASQSAGVRQLALSWDVSQGNVTHPAVQLLVSEPNPQITCGFLESVGRSDAIEAYRAFVASMPEDWFACYAGVFPGRAGHNLRVECIPSRHLQQAYARDVELLRQHLAQVGFVDVGDTLLQRCQLMAQTPFAFELQFDVGPDGMAQTTLGVSLRFACPPGHGDWGAFDPSGAAGDLMQRVQDWGLADDRWQLLADAAFAKRVSRDGASTLLYCYPAFLKLRWRGGEPLDAKAYLIAGTQ